MIKNYIITAWRNFKNNRAFTMLNIVGLALGLACCLVAYTIVNFELSFDNFHQKKDRIFRVVRHYNGDQGTTFGPIVAYPLGDVVKSDIAGLEAVVQTHGPIDAKLAFKDNFGNTQAYLEEYAVYADEQFFEVFDFQIASGQSASVLSEPNKVFLTESLAKKYFGNDDPAGKTLLLDDKINLEVVGVLEDPPHNINLSFDLIISHSTLRNLNPGIFKQWGMRWAASLFVLTNENTTKGTIEAALKNIPKTYFPEEHALKTIYKLQPLAQMHTDELYGDGVGYVAPSLALWAFIIMGALLLGTACLNFVNLSTAQAIKRSREVGVRKTLGGSRSQLIFQFLTETLIIVLISVVLSMTIAQVMISQLNTFLTPLDYEVSFSSSIVWFISALIVLVTLLGGLYPSLVMSSYQPIQALTQKITGKRGSGSFNLRRMLVIVQFVFTNLLLICSFIVSDQMDFLKNKPLGFNKDRVVTLGFPQGSYERMKTVKQAFEQKAYIEEATLCHGSPFSVNGDWQTGYTIQGQPYVDGQTSFWKFVDENYLEFFDIPIIEGKPLEARSINDSTYDVLVNKKFISKLGWTAKESIGRKIEFNGNRIGTIIGVTPDFHAGSLHDAIRPVLFCYEPSRIELMALRLVSSVETQALSDMEHTFRTFFPDDVFLATNLSKAIDQEYMVEDLLYGVIQFTTIISIIISMLGLYGLISFIANSNAKSIGVRKVFGASTFSIIRVFTREYFILIFIAFLLAAPLSYLGMQEWINEYAYRIDLHLGFFIWALLGSLSLAVITVGYKSYLAASANPAQSLRYE